MAIAEWIIWGIACIVLLSFIGAAITTRDSGLRRHHTQHCFLITIGLLVTLITPMSKLHLLWWVPVTFFINMLLSNFLMASRLKRGLREFEKHRFKDAPVYPEGTFDNIIADKETGLYHHRNCENAGITDLTKKILFGSENDAEEQGFKPCELCCRKNDGEQKGNHA